MEEVFRLLISVAVLFLGIPIGNVLRDKTKDEMKQGAKWFRIIVFLSLIIGLVGLVI